MQTLSSTSAAASSTVAQTQQAEPGRRPLFYVVSLILISGVIYVGNAFYPALLDDADASHALVAREMLQRGDWVVTYMNGIRYLMKAPLHYWAVAASYVLFGQTEFAVRLPVALSMVLLTLMTFEFGRRFFGLRAGFYSGLVTATSIGMFLFTRIMIPEAIYALEFTAAFYLFLRAWTGSLNQRVGYWGVAVLIGLAVLTRGLIGVVFPVFTIAGFVVATKSWNRWRELHLFSGTLIFAVIAVPWHVLAELRAPGFFWSYFINEHINRALGTRYPPDYDAVPLLLWWAAHLVWLFPWSVFAGFALKQLPHPRTWWSGNMSSSGQARLLLFIWAGVILGFFSVLGGSRMEYYSFGAWPGLAILLGLGLAHAEAFRPRWLPLLQGVLAGIGVLIAGALGYLVWQSSKLHSTGDISSLLKMHENDFYRLSMGHLFDLTPQAFADLRIPALGAALVFGVGFAIAWVLRLKRRSLPATVCLAMVMAGFMCFANMALGTFSPRLSSKTLALQIKNYLRPQDQIALYGEFDAGSSIAFYCNRRVYLYNGRYDNLEFGSHYPDAPKIFLKDGDFPTFWNQSARVFLFVQPELQQQAFSRLALLSPGSVWLLAEHGGKQVFVNQKLAPDQISFAQYLQERNIKINPPR
ncbi:MAG TPA: glycosyltransferase family 39 protein [Terriglobales bacterium]|nr:glycosyltransferase family 39 protein [Terriglobales bacterium]